MTELTEPDFWDNGEYVYWCLADKPRTETFRAAVRAVVRPGDLVYDIGSGSGVLGLTAAQCGAGRVVLVEIEPDLCRGLRETVARASLGDRVEVLQEDALELEIPRAPDVVICEMIATGMVSEFQGRVINRVLRSCKWQTRFVPGGYRCVADLVSKRLPAPDLDLFVVSYDYGDAHPDDEDAESLTDAFRYASFDFSRRVPEAIDVSFVLTVTGRGSINGLRLGGITDLTDHGTFGSTAAYSMPMILPLTPRAVRPGDSFRVRLQYEIGGGLGKLRYHVEPEAQR